MSEFRLLFPVTVAVVAVAVTLAGVPHALVPEGGVERGLTSLFTEINRVARFGFTATELNRQKLNLQRYLQIAATEKDKSASGPLADEFIRNFIHGEPIPGIVYEFGLNQRFLPEITLAEVNSLAKDWAPDRNRLVVISAPQKDRPALPTEARMAAAQGLGNSWLGCDTGHGCSIVFGYAGQFRSADAMCPLLSSDQSVSATRPLLR